MNTYDYLDFAEQLFLFIYLFIYFMQLTDLAFFLVILVVVIFAYGTASQTLRYPNDTVEWGLLKDMVYLPYWQMYGELMLDQVEGKQKCDNEV